MEGKMTTTETGNSGVTIDQRLTKFFDMLRVKTDENGHIVRDPNTERGESVARQAEGIQKIVEGSLGDSKTADNTRAKDIVYKLSQEFSKTYGHKDLATLPDERRKEYLSTALSALGLPGVSNENQLVQSIMNMARPGSKPGDPLYDQSAALVQLIQYIAGRKDKGQGEFSAELTELLNLYQSPKDAIQIVEGFKSRGVKVGPSATAAQFQIATREYQGEQTRRYVDSMPKTYHNGGSAAGTGAPVHQ